MTRPLFVPEPGLDEELGRLAGVRAALLATGEDIVDEARRSAPERTGHYRESLEAVVDGGVVRVQSTDPSSHLIEWGSVNNPPYAPIRQGVTRAGYRIDEAPK